MPCRALDSKTKFNGVVGSEAHIRIGARLLPRPALLNYRLQLPRAGAGSFGGGWRWRCLANCIYKKAPRRARLSFLPTEPRAGTRRG